MSFFQQYQGSRLYLPSTPGDPGWLGYLLPPGTTNPPAGLELQDALTTQAGSFLFSAAVPDFAPSGALTAFIGAVDGVINQLPATRGMLWIADPGAPAAGTPVFLGLDPYGQRVATSLTAPIVQAPGTPGTLELAVQVNSNTAVGTNESSLTLSGSGSVSGAVSWTGNAAPQAGQVNDVVIPCAGPWRGCLRFGVQIQRQSLNDSLNWGFQFLYPSSHDPVHKAVPEWLPLAAGYLPDAGDMVGFDATIDPADPLCRLLDRTALTFTGITTTNAGTTTPTVLVSCYRTTYGAPVTLVPAPGPRDVNPNAGRLAFHAGAVEDDGGEAFQASPAGDFVLRVDSGPPAASYDLMCGMQGTEFIAFQPPSATSPGDRLRFAAHQPAFAARYPFPAASPVDAPLDPHAPLLDTTYLTSWAQVIRAPGGTGSIPYVAQPRGASLYGRDALIYGKAQGATKGSGYTTLFGPLDPSVVLPQSALFPLAPYSAFAPGDGTSGMNAADSDRFEREVIGPTRRKCIGGGATAPSRAAAFRSGLAAAATDAGVYNTTTPTGLLVSVNQGAWTKVLLGQNNGPAPSGSPSALRQMYFCHPNAVLQQALQTGQLFMVAANADNLGAIAGAGLGDCPSGAAFYNRINVGAWDMAADVGQNNRYDDYTNVLIIKGRKGALYDPTSPATRAASLVSNPEQWTQKDALAAPSDLQTDPATGKQVPGPADPTELAILSGWLQRYFADAAAQGDGEYFQNFNTIAKSQHWTGILILRARIAKLPDDLAGVMAGVSAPQRFFAHHVGIQISPVANDPAAADIELSDPSSIFGLIYYVDPAFTPPASGKVAQPVPPGAGLSYDFRLLTLKVLFENTAVQRFQSWAQLTANQFFGMPVTRMGGTGANPFNTVVLSGSYQNNDGKPVYSLATAADSTFFFDANNVVRKIEVQSAAMSTLNPGNQKTNPTVISWFGLTGLIDFHVTWQVSDPGDGKPRQYRPFDVFSFGSDETPPGGGSAPSGDGQPGRGLAFTNLGIQMTFPPSDTASRTFDFVSSQTRFDITRSTPRPGSLFLEFALQLQGITGGTKDAGPGAEGYLSVIPDAMYQGVDGGVWTGLRYGLNLGTPGALAGSVGLTSQLLTAWSASSTGDASYRAAVGLQLPGTGGGAKLISLQTVLTLSIGQLRLARDPDKSAFLLMMSEIALKFLGLLKIPPSGSTLFYLFGNPKSDGKPSGLGWYAMYTAGQPKSLAAAGARNDTSRTGAAL